MGEQKIESSTFSTMFGVKTYTKRKGVVNEGHGFEYLTCTLYALKLIIKEEIIDFEITTSNLSCNEVFDDIELKITFKNNEQATFLYQLKHKFDEGISEYTLTQRSIKKDKNGKDIPNKLYLPSYIQSIPKSKLNHFYILYTNTKCNLQIDKEINSSPRLLNKAKRAKFVQLENSTDTTCNLTPKQESQIKENKPSYNVTVKECTLKYAQFLANNGENGKLFQFESRDTNPESYAKFHLFTGQYDPPAIRKKIKEQLSALFQRDIYDQLEQNMRNWWSKEFVLTKDGFLTKLTELALSPYIRTLSNKICDEKAAVLEQAIMQFDATIITDVNDDVIDKIWKEMEIDPSSKNLNSSILKHFETAEIELSDQEKSKYLWDLGKVPLVVKIDENLNETLIKQTLSLWQKCSDKKKIILIGNMSKEDLPGWNIFENLDDLITTCENKDVGDNCLKLFTISLQGRDSIPLEGLIKIDKEFGKAIAVNELYNSIRLKHCIEIGEPSARCTLPYIKRTLKQVTNVVNEDDLYNEFNSQLNIICGPPGMGKSRLMEKLIANCPPDYWTVNLNLKRYDRILLADDFETTRIHFLGLDTYKENSVTSTFIKIFLKNKRIRIFLDDLDKTSDNNVSMLLSFAERISSEGASVWIFSRDKLREKIEEHSQPFEIQPLDVAQQKELLNELLNNFDKKKINDVLFENPSKVNINELLQNPQQLTLIAKMFRNVDSYQILKQQNTIVPTEVCKEFFTNVMLEKLSMNKNQKLSPIYYNAFLEPYTLAAIKSCLNSDFEKIDVDPTSFKDSLDEAKQNGNSFGIKNVMDDFPAFYFQTYAEYLACLWFKKNKGKVKLLGEQLLTEEKYNQLRIMFDIVLAETKPLHLAVICENPGHFDNIKNIGDKDDGGRNVLHLACCYGRSYPTKIDRKLSRESNSYRKLFEILMANDSFNTNEPDELFGFNYVDYAAKCLCIYPLDQILKYRGEWNWWTTYVDVKHVDTWAFYAIQFGYCNLLNKIIEDDPEIVNRSIESEHVLLIAVNGCEDDQFTEAREGNISVVKILLEKNANNHQFTIFEDILAHVEAKDIQDMNDVLQEWKKN